ncbi:10753_t:CDS:1, partial [Funneliformis caledonium]
AKLRRKKVILRSNEVMFTYRKLPDPNHVLRAPQVRQVLLSFVLA